MIYVKNYIIQGEGLLSKNDITWDKQTDLTCNPTRKVNKAKQLTCLSTHIGGWLFAVHLLVVNSLNKPLLKIQAFTFYKTTYLNEEDNSTEPSPFRWCTLV
jgi:hypothetical protein